MEPIILGLGGLLMLIALLIKSEKKDPANQKMLTEDSPKPYAKGLPDNVKHVVIRLAKDQKPAPTKTELELAASTATVSGYTMLGEVLLKRAEAAPETAPFKGVPSPLPTIHHDVWTKFVKLMGEAPATAADRGRYGIFQMGVRRLVDFGLMTKPRKQADGSWTADWKIPEARFTGDPALQYKIFARSMTNYRDEILRRYRDAVGTKLDGQAATLSGLLAVAHYTGIDGLGKWLSSPELRAKFKATSAAYKKANGIF